MYVDNINFLKKMDDFPPGYYTQNVRIDFLNKIKA